MKIENLLPNDFRNFEGKIEIQPSFELSPSFQIKKNRFYYSVREIKFLIHREKSLPSYFAENLAVFCRTLSRIFKNTTLHMKNSGDRL